MIRFRRIMASLEAKLFTPNSEHHRVILVTVSSSQHEHWIRTLAEARASPLRLELATGHVGDEHAIGLSVSSATRTHRLSQRAIPYGHFGFTSSGVANASALKLPTCTILSNLPVKAYLGVCKALKLDPEEVKNMATIAIPSERITSTEGLAKEETAPGPEKIEMMILCQTLAASKELVFLCENAAVHEIMAIFKGRITQWGKYKKPSEPKIKVEESHWCCEYSSTA